MTMTNSGLVAGAVALSLAGSAQAADFNGPYVGAQIGWNSNQIKNPDTSLGTLPMDDDQQSLTGGIYAGFDRKLNDKVVVGLEGGLDFSKDDYVKASAPGVTYSLDPKYSFDLTARAGYLVNPDTLVYARGGYTNVRVKTKIDTALGTDSGSDNKNGWLVGAGIERQFLNNASARVEYRYSDVSEGDGNFDRHRVLAGLTYRF